MTYELLLGQALSAFLGNTLERYAVTIGLYMFSLGFGAYLAEKRWDETPLSALLIIEALLALLGGFSIVFLHLIDSPGSELLFSVFAHGLIFAIGTLSGFELPLLMTIAVRYLNNSEGLAERKILSFSYIGAFSSTIIFAFYFYPRVGIVATAFMVALLNAYAGLMIGMAYRAHNIASKKYIVTHVCLVATFLAFWLGSAPINQFLVEQYLTSAARPTGP